MKTYENCLERQAAAQDLYRRKMRARAYIRKTERRWHRKNVRNYAAFSCAGILLGALLLFALGTAEASSAPQTASAAPVHAEATDEGAQISAALLRQHYFYATDELLAASAQSDALPEEQTRRYAAFGEEVQGILHAACDEFSVPFPLGVAVCWAETEFRNLATVHGGVTYYGYMAVHGDCNGALMEEIGAADLRETVDGLRTGCAILGDYLSRYDTHRALMAYNMGEAAAAELWGLGVTETDFSRAVTGYAERLVAT